MSSTNAQEFIQLLQQDESLKNQIDQESTSKEGAIDMAVSLGKEKGLDFNGDELQSALKTVGVELNNNGGIEPLSGTVGQEGELSEEALEAVAGGYVSGRDCSQW